MRKPKSRKLHSGDPTQNLPGLTSNATLGVGGWLGAWSSDARLDPLPARRAPRRRGPQPGTVDRYGAADRELYPDLKRLMSEQQMSRTAAARQLAGDGKVAGNGTKESQARRLAKRYRDDSQ